MKLYEKYKWSRLCTGMIFLLIGILTIIITYINVSIVSATLSISIAAVLFMIGGVSLISNFIDHDKSIFTTSLAVAALCIAVGVVLCIRPTFLGDIIVYFMAAFAIAFGCIEIVKGIQLIRYHSKWYLYVTCFVIAAILIAFGIISLVIGSGGVLTVIYTFVGCCFILIGVNESVIAIKKLK